MRLGLYTSMCQAPTTQTWQVDTFLAYISNEELDTFILLDTFISLLSYLTTKL